ncbi:MAG: hypothetical protein V8T62_07560 [Oscillospiraceae bacterium]
MLLVWQAETLPRDGCTGQCDRSAPSTGAGSIAVDRSEMDHTLTNLHAETILESDEDTVRVITDGNHDRIVAVEHAPFEPYISQNLTDDSLEAAHD